MNIPVDSMISILIVVLSAIGAALCAVCGALWGHHGEILNRVKYSECSHKRENCPCVKDIEEIKDELRKNK